MTIKEEATRIIHSCALLYLYNLSCKNIMFVSNNNNQSAYFESSFLPHNFLHLTGVSLTPDKTIGLDKSTFLQFAAEDRVSPNHINFATDGTTKMKLSVLPNLMNIHQTAKMIGEYKYKNLTSRIVADKVAGTVTSALGFKDVHGIYVPNTALKEDVRNITNNRQQVLAIFVKSHNEEKYTHLTYITKNTTIDSIILNPIIGGKIDIKYLYATFEIPRATSTQEQTQSPKYDRGR
ncbi:hypothetical protein FACS1894187_05770 [Synergistales bacterium]|nr:hypothetical protein FACS1894187_05770 [Synergistales bacterium]